MKETRHNNKLQATSDTAPADFMSRLRQTFRLILHIPDYDTYVRHLQETRPHEPVPTYEQFVAMCQERRFRADYLIGKC